MTPSDISPYLLRPVRSLEEAKAQAEQQRLELLAASTAPALDQDARKHADATSISPDSAPTS